MKKVLCSFILIVNLSFLYGNDLYDDFHSFYDSAINETNGEKSLVYSFKMLEIANQLNNNELIAKSKIEIASDYIQLGNYLVALKYAIQVQETFENIHDIEVGDNYLGMTYNLIGSIYIRLENYFKAIIYFQKAASCHHDYNLVLFDDYYNIGETYRLLNRNDSAFYYLRLAEKLLVEDKLDSLRWSFVNCDLGLVYLQNQENQKGDSLLKISLNYFLNKGHLSPVCESYYEMANIYYKNKDNKKAENYAHKALAMGLESNLNNTIVKIYNLLGKIAVEKGDYQHAYEYEKQYYVYKDSLVNSKVVSQIAEQRAEFEIERKQVEVDHFKALSKARIKFIVILSTGLLSILILALFLWRVNKKRKQANELLGEYNEELTQKNQIIHMALEEKEVLMKEIHHRVKNNLQIISSIISLQNMRIDDERTQEIFREMQRRIMAISSIHQKLYQGDSVSQINIKEYLTEVVDSIHTAFNNEALGVSYEVMVNNVRLDIDAAVSMGLIVNELATNAYKYAFKSDRNNHFLVSLRNLEQGCELQVIDNGSGINDKIDILNSDSLGLRMVNLLARQMKGKVTFENNNGAHFNIILNELNLLN